MDILKILQTSVSRRISSSMSMTIVGFSKSCSSSASILFITDKDMSLLFIIKLY